MVEGKDSLADSWKDLIQDSVQIISSAISPPEAMRSAWDTLCDISQDDNNHNDLLLPQFSLLQHLIQFAGARDAGANKGRVWTILNRLIGAPENEPHFILPLDSSFPNVLVATIQTDEQHRQDALAVLHSLSVIPENRAVLVKPEARLLPVLAVLLQFDEESVCTCCRLLLTLADDHTCSSEICATETLISAFSAVMSRSAYELTLRVADVLSKLSASEPNRVLLLQPTFGLVPILIAQLELFQTRPAMMDAICCIFFNMSKQPPASVQLSHHRSDLFPSLLRTVRGYVIHEVPGPGRVFALYTLLNLAKVNNEIRDELGVMGNGMYSTLISIAQESLENNNALIVACQLLNRLSFSHAAREKLLLDAEASDTEAGTKDLITALLNALLRLIQSDEGVGRVVACSFMWNVISDDAYGPYLLPLIPDIIPVLVDVVRKDRETYARLKALGILCNIIRYGDSSIKDFVMLPEIGLLTAVADVLKHYDQCKPEELQKACNIVDALCFSPSVSTYMTSDDLELLPTLVGLLTEAGNRETTMHVCSIFWNLFVHGSPELALKTMEFDLIGRLVAVVIKEGKMVRYKALGALCNLAVLPQTRAPISAPSLGLLPALVSIVRSAAAMTASADVERTLELALKLLSFLSLDEVVVEAMASTELGLVAMLVELADEWEHNRTGFHKTIPAVLWNISCVKTLSKAAKDLSHALTLDKLVHWIEGGHGDMLQAGVYIFSNSIFGRLVCNPNLPSDPGFARAIRAILDVFRTDKAGLGDCAIGGLWSITEGSSAKAVCILLSEGVHIEVLQRLKNMGPKRSNWNNFKIGSKCLNFLMNLASHPAAVDTLRDCSAIDVVLPVLMHADNGCEGIKAMFVVAFLVGRDESRESVALLHARPGTIETIIQTLTDTLNGKEGEDYPSGTFCIKLMIQAVLTLSISDVHKQALLQTNIVFLLRDVLLRFHRGDSEVPSCGGGGTDIDSATLSLSALLHLSFAHESDQDLQRLLIPPQLGFVDLLEGLIGDGSRLPLDTAHTAGQLLQRLLPVDEVYGTTFEGTREIQDVTDVDEGALDTEERRQHVMISYCWDETARPDLARRLAVELRNSGYDVWVDKEGSEAVPAVSGCVHNCTLEAVQRSDAVVICVSRKYKQSANCRMEARYACHLAKRGELRLYFVMMDENYTTVTAPRRCDGWLGLMVGNQLWYALWDDSRLKQTALQLAGVLSHKSEDVLAVATSTASTLIDPSVPTQSKCTVDIDPVSAESEALFVTEKGPSVHDATVADSDRQSEGENTSAIVDVDETDFVELFDESNPVSQSVVGESVPAPFPEPPSKDTYLRPPLLVSPRPTTASFLHSADSATVRSTPARLSEFYLSSSGATLHDTISPKPSAVTSPIFNRSGNNNFLSSSRITLGTSDKARYGKVALMNNMWQLLCNPNKVRDTSGLQACLGGLGITDADELEYCDQCQIEEIAALLLPIPRKIFIKKMCQFLEEQCS